MASAWAPPRGRGRLERQLHRDGLSFIGVDEVGRGCLAGPVHAGFVHLDWTRLGRLSRQEKLLVRDSKQLSSKQRAALVPLIEGVALSWQVASASVEEIDTFGIVAATFLAMRRAIDGCGAAIDVLLIDGKLPLRGYCGRQEAIIKGDSLCFSIAAASILAKERRDQYMRDQAQLYPQYGFAAHVGYGTQLHLDKIKAHGICPLHRTSFAPIRTVVATAAATPPAKSRGRRPLARQVAAQASDASGASG